MIGHEKIVSDLTALAARGSLGHGYIFFGPAMVGKKSAAQEFACYLEYGDRAKRDLSRDMSLIEAGENGSIGIDAVRAIKNFLWQKPVASPRRTLIVNDAERMTAEAQNAILKITEEPPASSLVILVASDLESIMPTILSRLPKIYLGAVRQVEIERWLMGELGVKRGEAKTIAAKSFGKPGLAWRLLNDRAFQKEIELAATLLATPAAVRRDFLKKIMDPDDFNFRKFLDAVIMNLAWRDGEGRNAASRTLWHRALALYDREANFSLNSRLQLEALLA